MRVQPQTRPGETRTDEAVTINGRSPTADGRRYAFKGVFVEELKEGDLIVEVERGTYQHTRDERLDLRVLKVREVDKKNGWRYDETTGRKYLPPVIVDVVEGYDEIRETMTFKALSSVTVLRLNDLRVE